MTIAQQLNIQQFPFSIKNEAGQEIYIEDAIRNWVKKEYDEQDRTTRYESSSGPWAKWEYDAAGHVTRYEESTGYWYKSEYNTNGRRIYFESEGKVLRDDRPKTVELTMDEIAEKLGIDVNLLKIKK
jgi:YD repeat-containing protein